MKFISLLFRACSYDESFPWVAGTGPFLCFSLFHNLRWAFRVRWFLIQCLSWRGFDVFCSDSCMLMPSKFLSPRITTILSLSRLPGREIEVLDLKASRNGCLFCKRLMEYFRCFFLCNFAFCGFPKGLSLSLFFWQLEDKDSSIRFTMDARAKGWKIEHFE